MIEMVCKQSGYLHVGESFSTPGGVIKVLSVYIGDYMNVNTVSYELQFTAPNGEVANIPAAGMGFEATFSDLDTKIRVWDLSFTVVMLEICYPEVPPEEGGKEIVFPFSKAITVTPKITEWITKIVKILGGKRAYLEDGNKIVVVL